MNRLSPKKLLHSKWTAVKPIGKAKHFMVVELELDESGKLTRCLLQAVVTKRTRWLPWRELKDQSDWLQGWV
ncbi:MAG: TIGR02450 family Trp-rich protein [Pseudomonadota bacterium]